MGEITDAILRENAKEMAHELLEIMDKKTALDEVRDEIAQRRLEQWKMGQPEYPPFDVVVEFLGLVVKEIESSNEEGLIEG